MQQNEIRILTTGGTIDKVYFDALSEFQVGETSIERVLKEAGVELDYKITELFRKDSLELTYQDRQKIRSEVEIVQERAILITHGTDSMVETANAIGDIKDKTIVLTGAMQPASMRSTDAVFNIGFAVAATQMLPSGIFVAMNGRIFDPKEVRKDRSAQVFRNI